MRTKSRPGTPAPVRLPHDEPYWEATARGVLSVKRCEDCSSAHWYPRRRCPFCGSDNTVWEAVSGRGRVYSFAIVAGSRKPRAAAIVELAEGLRINTAIADCDVHEMAIGDEVRVAFETAEDGTRLPVFTTLAADRAREYSRTSLEASRDVPGVDLGRARTVETAGVIGAGTMGTGIAKALLAGGLRVVLVDTDAAARERARADVEAHLDRLGLPHDRLRTDEAIRALGDVDLVVEAVWEQATLKRSVLAEADAVTRDDCILATNTSSLDVDDLAGATTRPERVLGLHFFSPAHVMKLVEVVPGRHTDPDVVATAMEMVRQVEKTPVAVGVCPGFVGNRLMFARNRQAESLLLQGALPEQVDRVLREFGLPMGPYEMLDLGGGIELSYRRRQETGQENWLVDELYRRGHRGQRSGKGYYRYEEGSRRPLPDPDVAAVVAEASARAGIERRRVPDAEIRNRLILPMVNEAARIIEEGVVNRPSDIDVVWRHGFGWPDWKGGPVYYADQVGVRLVVEQLAALAEQHGEAFTPAPLLVRLAASGGRLLDSRSPGASRGEG